MSVDLSIVIPTARRPQWLPQAISSAAESARGLTFEIIVVPNGADDSWTESTAPFRHEPWLSVVPIVTPHANVARNSGLVIATGKWIRFLDDDDTLEAGSSVLQCDRMARRGAEICSGAVAVIDAAGRAVAVMHQPSTNDLLSAVMRPSRVCLPTAHVFLREAVMGFRWDPSAPYEQDTKWILDLCAAREWHWLRIPETVGTWRQHVQSRTSKTIDSPTRARTVVAMQLATLDAVIAHGRMTDERADAFSEGLWTYAHRNFFRDPRFWAGITRKARDLSPTRLHPAPLFNRVPFRYFHPLAMELLFMPKRWLNAFAQRLMRRLRRL